MRAASIQVAVPAWGQDPSGVHGEAAPVAGRRGPHLCPAPEIVTTLWAVELGQAPHLVTRHWFVTLPTLATP